jgi:hypothetical protein
LPHVHRSGVRDGFGVGKKLRLHQAEVARHIT